MTYKEARNSVEFSYTGMSWRKWDKDEEETNKETAKKIKREYRGVDYRIVDEGNGFKSIYGNNLFNRVMFFDEERVKRWIDSYQERVDRLNEEYREKLRKLDEDLARNAKEYNEIISHKRCNKGRG